MVFDEREWDESQSEISTSDKVIICSSVAIGLIGFLTIVYQTITIIF